MARKYRNLYERLVANTKLANPDDPDGCWLWTGPRRGHYGCLCVRIPGGGRATKPKTISAHRAMLEEYHDIVFPFDEAGHLCFNTMCINPRHLEVQTQVFNLGQRRGYREPEGSMIPTLFPRSQWLDDMIEDALNCKGVLVDADAECPF